MNAAPTMADFAPVMPELICADLGASVAHYHDVFSFRIRFKRRGFAMMERDGAQVMLMDEANARRVTGPLQAPYGRGVHLRIAVSGVADLADDIEAAGHELFEPLHEVWYNFGGEDAGYRQCLAQDPDGYLLRFAEPIGRRPRASSDGGEA